MSEIHFVDIGFSNYVEVSKVESIMRPDSSPVKRMIQHAKETHHFFDLTQGKKTRSIIVQQSESGPIITASAVQTSTIVERIRRAQQERKIVEKISDNIVEVTSD